MPTAQGYRVFVDSLLQVRPLPEGEIARLRSELPAGSGTQALLGNASELLSAMTHFVGVVRVPQARAVRLPPDRFRAAGRPARAGDPGVRRQRGAEPDHPDAPAVRRAASWSRSPITSTPISPAAPWPTSARTCCASCAAPATRWNRCWRRRSSWPSRRSCPAREDMVLAGQTRLMGVQDLADLDRLRELFEAFARKREILQLLERTVQRAGRAHLHRRGNRPGAAGRHVAGDRALRRRRAGAGRAGRDRPDPHGLRPRDPGGAGRRRGARGPRSIRSPRPAFDPRRSNRPNKRGPP